MENTVHESKGPINYVQINLDKQKFFHEKNNIINEKYECIYKKSLEHNAKIISLSIIGIVATFFYDRRYAVLPTLASIPIYFYFGKSISVASSQKDFKLELINRLYTFSQHADTTRHLLKTSNQLQTLADIRQTFNESLSSLVQLYNSSNLEIDTDIALNIFNEFSKLTKELESWEIQQSQDSNQSNVDDIESKLPALEGGIYKIADLLTN